MSNDNYYEQWVNKFKEEYNNLNHNDKQHLIDWYESLEDKRNILRFNPELAVKKSHKWTAKLLKSLQKVEELPDSVKLVRDFKDMDDKGFRVVQLLNKDAFEYEGSQMKHCVSSYADKNTTIYSLRDALNKPHCTMEFIDGQVRQIKGKANSSVKVEYIRYVLKFLEELDGSISKSELSNLHLSVFPKGILKELGFVDYKPVTFKGEEYIYHKDKYWAV